MNKTLWTALVRKTTDKSYIVLFNLIKGAHPHTHTVPYGNHGCYCGDINTAFLYVIDNGGVDTWSYYPYEAKVRESGVSVLPPGQFPFLFDVVKTPPKPHPPTALSYYWDPV